MKSLYPALAIGAALSTTSALAADLPSRKAPPPAYAAPAPVLSWNGLYGGLNLGGGWSAGGRSNGYVIGGGQVGYNLQFAPNFLAGLETDFQGASGRLNWLGTLRGRLGFVPTFAPNFLVYGTGGFAYGQVRRERDDFARNAAWLAALNPGGAPAFPPVFGWGNGGGGGGVKTGWTAGGGGEWMFHQNWSAKVEYLYTDLSGDNGGGWGGGRRGHNRSNLLRAGVNYHFNVATPAPVFAKY